MSPEKGPTINFQVICWFPEEYVNVSGGEKCWVVFWLANEKGTILTVVSDLLVVPSVDGSEIPNNYLGCIVRPCNYTNSMSTT